MADAKLLRELREDLVSCYKESVSNISISPVRDELDVPLEALYVQPRLMVITEHIFGQGGSASSNEIVTSYKEIFFGKEDIPYKNIYISANAGMGKTSFARKITLTWCEAVQPGKHSNRDFYHHGDLKTVKHFDIIFYIQLSDTKYCDIAEIISDFIESRLCRSYLFSKVFVEQVLDNNKCLVILDGLDQWTHPESCRRQGRQGVPHNRRIRNVTLMTTTRPWKMSEMRLSTNQIDRHLELLDLTRRTVQDLEANAIRLLKDHTDSQFVGKDVDDFDDLIDKAELKDILRKPYILLQLVCVWADGRHIGRSKFEAYCNIIALNIERRKFTLPRETTLTRPASDFIVPEYMQKDALLAENICKFLKVGELGLFVFCEELKAPAYTFDELIALKYLTSDEIDFFAETGILSRIKDTRIISKPRKIVTFQHKEIEEFFVALFMASVWKDRNNRRIILKAFRSLPDLFKSSFNNVMNLVKDINNDIYKDMYKRLTDKESAVDSEDIRLYGSSLIRMTEEEIVQLVEDCVDEKQCFANGSFGMLFKSDGLKNRCGITVAVKKIHDDRQLDDIPNTVKKEMNVSKVLHSFLLPLIAVIREVDEGRNTFYLISPFCEQGDLYKVLHTNKIPLNQVQRIRIVLQIALGIQHLHTFVEGIKDVIIHKDICSDNIILDGRKNARLIDFGLARDKSDHTNTISKRIHYTHPDVGTGKEATEFWDYFSFGVVIRELLTGLPPEGKKETNLFLKKMKLKDVLDNLDQEVWPKQYETHDDLNKMAEICLQPQSTFSFQKDVVEKLQSIIEQAVWVPEKDVTPRCAQCMINPPTSKAAETMHTSNCIEDFGLCVPCEKRSILCPVKCYGCGETLKPAIGKDWAALLVAGNDTANPKLAEAFKSDVKNMKKVVTSKTPLIMGISEENVHVITPEKPGIPEELLPRIKKAMKNIKDSGSHTLVVYFSCLGKTIFNWEKSNAFQLGSEEELLPTEEFQKLFEQNEHTGKIQKVILFMDSCFPTQIKFHENKKIKAIQLNACESNKTALVNEQGSIFTKYLIEGLTTLHCKTNEDTKKSASNDYITAGQIQEYINKHMKEDDGEALMFFSGSIQSDDFKIAYDTADDVDVEISYGKDKKSVTLDLCQKMEDLENALKNLFNKEIDRYDVHIQKDTHRSRDQYVDCTTVESVMTACVLRQPLIVTFSNHVKPKQEGSACVQNIEEEIENLRRAYNEQIEYPWKDNASKEAKIRWERLAKSINQEDLMDVLESDKVLGPVSRELLTIRDPDTAKDLLSKGSTMIGKIKLFMELTNQEDAFTKEIRKLIVDAKEEPVFEQSDETNESLKGEWENSVEEGDAIRLLHLITIKRCLPTALQLTKACKRFGRKSTVMRVICQLICKFMQSNEDKTIMAAYRENNENHVIFVSSSFVDTSRSSENRDVIYKEVETNTRIDIDVMKLMKKAINKNSEFLRENHSNITMITGSPYRSIGYKKGAHSVEKENCIVILVPVKGVIPLGENIFPKTIDGFKTDVREVVIKLLTGGKPHEIHEYLKIGCAIGRNAKDGSIGTLGGFVYHPDHGLCGLTCAHVLLNETEITRGPMAEELGCLQPYPFGKQFGKLVDYRFQNNGDEKAGIDIALIKIDERHPVNGDFCDIEQSDLEKAGFSRDDSVSYTSGAVCSDVSSVRDNRIVKYGSKSLLRRGVFGFEGLNFAYKAVKYFEDSNFVIKNQIQIYDIANCGPFSEEGDSGSLVFAVSGNELLAVGLLIGGGGGFTLMTPIHEILQYLGCTMQIFQVNNPVSCYNIYTNKQFPKQPQFQKKSLQVAEDRKRRLIQKRKSNRCKSFEAGTQTPSQSAKRAAKSNVYRTCKFKKQRYEPKPMRITETETIEISMDMHNDCRGDNSVEYMEIQISTDDQNNENYREHRNDINQESLYRDMPSTSTTGACGGPNDAITKMF